MGYWIVADENGEYVAEAEFRADADAYVEAVGRDWKVVPFYEFYGLGSGS